MIRTLVLLGATGDLAGRFLLPGLAALQAVDRLPDDFVVVGAGRQDRDDEAFRRHVTRCLEQHADDVPAPAREAIVGALRYRRGDFTDPDSLTTVLEGAGLDARPGPVAVYLALPPALFAPTVSTLGAVGLPAGSRVVIEKPFGENLDGAKELNAALTEACGEAGEQAVFRVDHVLGMATVQNLVGLRLRNPLLEAVWNSRRVDRVEVLWEEELALEGRAGYYDRAGALKDVMQNHMLQVLALIAMEPPTGAAGRGLRDRRADALRAVRSLPPELMTSLTRRARYTAGRIGDRAIPAYAEEEGVDPGRRTETFAEVALEVGTERWAGTPFVLRAGKALARRRKEAVIRFRMDERPPEGGNELRIGLDGPVDLALQLTGSEPGTPPRPVPLTLTGPPPPSDLPAYGRVLLDVLEGGSALSVRGDEAELAWRVVTPVLEAWAADAVPLEEYAAGSSGPPRRG